MKLLGLLILALLIIGSVYLRANSKKRKYRFEGAAFPVEPSSSFLSEAIVELLAVAGGIYLALVMVAAFLQIDMSQKVIVGTAKLDLLALVSLALAFLHPFFTKFWCMVTGR